MLCLYLEGTRIKLHVKLNWTLALCEASSLLQALQWGAYNQSTWYWELNWSYRDPYWDTENDFSNLLFTLFWLSVFTPIKQRDSYWTGQLQGGVRGLGTSQTGLKFEIVFELLYKGPEFSAFYFSQKYQCKIRHSRSDNIAPDHQGQRISPMSKCGSKMMFWRYLSNLAIIMSWVWPALVRAEKLMLIGRNLKGRKKRRFQL